MSDYNLIECNDQFSVDNNFLKKRAEVAEAKLTKAVGVMKALQEDMLERSRAGMDTIHGEEYRIVNAGRTAWTDFCAVLAELEK